MDGIADVMVRLEDRPTSEAFARLREALRAHDGVISACTIREDPPVLMVLFNPMRLTLAEVLARVEDQGVPARLLPCPEPKAPPGAA